MQQPNRQYNSAIEVYVVSEMMFIKKGEGNEDQVQNEIVQKRHNEPNSQKKISQFLITSKKQQEQHQPIGLPIYPLKPYEKKFIKNMDTYSQHHPLDYSISIKTEYQRLNEDVLNQMKISYEEKCQNYLMEPERIIEERKTLDEKPMIL